MFPYYFHISFVLFIFLFILPSTYAMEKPNTLEIDLNIKDKLGKEDLKILQKLLASGINPNTIFGPNKMPLLSLATKHKQVNFVNCLLQYGADPNMYDPTGITPLHAILHADNWNKGKLDKVAMQILENLLHYHANPNASTPTFNITPLSLALNYDNDNNSVTKLLIKHGANVNKRDNTGNTYLKTAFIHQNLRMIEKLCTVGASLTCVDLYRNTVFHPISYNPPKEAIETVLIHGRPENNERLSATIKTVLLTFNRLKPQLPIDIQILILSKLLSDDYYHRGLCKKLLLQGSLKPLEIHITWLKKILQTKNKLGKTPLFGNQNKNEIESLLDGSQITKDYNALLENSNTKSRVSSKKSVR